LPNFVLYVEAASLQIISSHIELFTIGCKPRMRTVVHEDFASLRDNDAQLAEI